MTSSHHKRIAITNLPVTSLMIILCSTPAAADDTSGGNGGVPAVATASPGDTASRDTAATATGQPAEPGPRYPRAVIARPLTLPSGVAMLGLDVTSNNDLSAMSGAPTLGYGITDDLEVQVPYTFATREFEARGSLSVDVGYKLLRGALDGKLEAIARVRGGYNLLTQTANPLMLGVHVQYNLTDDLAVITGFPSTQQLSIALSRDAMTGARPIDVSLPLGLGYQATPLLYLQLDTRLARLDIKDSANAFLFSDTTPVALTATYNLMNALDVHASLGTDLSNSPGDAVSFLVGAIYYAGKL
ncbi:MAG: hypothetical protein E6J91_28305 [Deltaproteobacteria bacterium]|nr:MAG: hypothetical protein E6J91_28305 [Deltaproteobacteria bacterium]